jgi:vacuolar-type H+-ATPase subunit I/STV1
MAWIFELGGNKLEGEVNKIDKDIKRLLKELEQDPFGRGKKNEEYKKLIEKILKEIEEHKKSLHKLYGSRPNGLPELENLEKYLKMYYEKLKALEKGHPMAIHPNWFQNWLRAVQTDWHNHKIKFQHK